MKPRRSAMLLCLLLTMSSVLCTAQEAGYIDLTQVKVRPRRKEPSTGSSSGGEIGSGNGLIRQVRPPQLLSLTLLFANPAELQVGGGVIYEVRLENLGKEPVSIPWSPHPADFEPSDSNKAYEFASGFLSLWLVDESGRNETMLSGDASLFGRADVRGSLLNLLPGDRVRIRASARLGSAPPGQLGGREGTSFRLRAKFSLHQNTIARKGAEYNRDFRPLLPVVESVNAIEIAVRR